MKKIIYLLMLALTAAGVVSCSQDNEGTERASGRRVVLTGTNTDPQTRTSFGDMSGRSIPFLWSAGDQVWVNGQLSEAAGEEGQTARFVFDQLSGTTPYKVYYNMTGERFDQAHIPHIQTRKERNVADLGVNGDFGYALTDRDGHFTMEHLASYLWFAPYTSDIELHLASIQVRVDGTPIAGKRVFTDGQPGEITEGSEWISLMLVQDDFTLPRQPETDRMFATMVTYPLDLKDKEVKITYTFADLQTVPTESYTYTEVREGFKMEAGQTYRIAPRITMQNLLSQIFFKADDGDWVEYLPSGFARLAVRTEQDAVLGRETHAAIAQAMGSDAELDFSQAINESEVFGNYYANNTKLKSIILPSNVTSTADGTRNHSITHDGVFAKCTNLKTVVFPEGFERLGVVTFYGSSSLKNAVLPASVKEVGQWAFYNASSLENIEIPEGVEILPSHTFYGCTALKSAKLPSTLKVLAEGVFNSCSSLQQIEIPAGVAELPVSTGSGTSVFKGCTNLRKVILHEGLEHIGTQTFYECRQIEEITIPSSVKYIGTHAFYECKLLPSQRINAEKIDEFAFMLLPGTTGMASLTIGPNVKEIARAAFSGQRNVASLTFEGETCPTIYTASSGYYSFLNLGAQVDQADRALFVPEGSLTEYASAAGLSTVIDSYGFTVRTDGGGSELPEGLYFSQCGSDWTSDFTGFTGNYIYVKTTGNAVLTGEVVGALDSFVKERGVKTVLDMSQARYESTWFGDNYFYGNGYGNPGIFEVSMPWNIEVIGKQNFGFCDNLRAVILGENVRQIMEYAFSSNDIKAIVCKGATPPVLQNDFMTYGVPFLGWGPKSTPMSCYVPTTSIPDYSSENTWQQFHISTNNIQLLDIDTLNVYWWRSEL